MTAAYVTGMIQLLVNCFVFKFSADCKHIVGAYMVLAFCLAKILLCVHIKIYECDCLSNDWQTFKMIEQICEHHPSATHCSQVSQLFLELAVGMSQTYFLSRIWTL